MQIKSFFNTNINTNQCKDTGMAMTLILLIAGYMLNSGLYSQVAILFLILNMIYPRVFYPLAIIWLGFSQLMGSFMSKVILTLVYVILVVPIGVIRRMLGKDPLMLTSRRTDDFSVMKIREHTFNSSDLEKPF